MLYFITEHAPDPPSIETVQRRVWDLLESGRYRPDHPDVRMYEVMLAAEFVDCLQTMDHEVVPEA